MHFRAKQHTKTTRIVAYTSQHIKSIQPSSTPWLIQCSDIANHETWIIAAITAGWVSVLRV